MSNKFIVIYFIFLLILNICVIAADNDSVYSTKDKSKISISFQYGRYFHDLASCKDYFKDFVSDIRLFNGIHMPDQPVYPYSRALGLTILFPTTRYFSRQEVEIGFIYSDLKTKAFSLYGDLAGNVDLTSEIRFQKIGVTSRFLFFNNFRFIKPFFELNLGLVMMDYKVENNVFITLTNTSLYELRLSAEQKGAFGEAAMGLTQEVLFFIISEKFGFYFSELNEVDVIVNENGKVYSNAHLKQTFENSGFFFEIGLGLLLDNFYNTF